MRIIIGGFADWHVLYSSQLYIVPLIRRVTAAAGMLCCLYNIAHAWYRRRDNNAPKYHVRGAGFGRRTPQRIYQRQTIILLLCWPVSTLSRHDGRASARRGNGNMSVVAWLAFWLALFPLAGSHCGRGIEAAGAATSKRFMCCGPENIKAMLYCGESYRRS